MAAEGESLEGPAVRARAVSPQGAYEANHKGAKTEFSLKEDHIDCSIPAAEQRVVRDC